LVRDLNALYVAEPVLSRNDFNAQGFRWVSCHDADANLIAYLRMDPFEQTIFLVVAHFGGATRSYPIGVPRLGTWREVINSNSEYYGGTGLGNDGGRVANVMDRDGFAQAIEVKLSPFTTTVFKWSAS
jgi:1,4-alpha-glucan branching enzyme